MLLLLEALEEMAEMAAPAALLALALLGLQVLPGASAAQEGLLMPEGSMAATLLLA